ncbi:MAG: hypothetical protein ABI229_01685, partial [Gemmatimonadaceae bacterium]
YYNGIAAERHGQELRARVSMGSGTMAYNAFREAMDWYEKAEAIRPSEDDDSLLRWNTCARVLSRDTHLKPAVVTEYEPVLED